MTVVNERGMTARHVDGGCYADVCLHNKVEASLTFKVCLVLAFLSLLQ